MNCNLLEYQLQLAILESVFRKRLISQAEYSSIKTTLENKYKKYVH